MQYDWNMGDAVRLKVKCTWLVVFVSLEDSSVGIWVSFPGRYCSLSVDFERLVVQSQDQDQDQYPAAGKACIGRACVRGQSLLAAFLLAYAYLPSRLVSSLLLSSPFLSSPVVSL